ncbi:MAG: DNA repair protein RadA, partial [Acidimicrobiales bacterium]
VGLGGELRRVPHTAARLREAARLGFAKAVVPTDGPEEPGIECIPVKTVAEAVVVASGEGHSRKIERCRIV